MIVQSYQALNTKAIIVYYLWMWQRGEGGMGEALTLCAEEQAIILAQLIPCTATEIKARSQEGQESNQINIKEVGKNGTT